MATKPKAPPFPPKTAPKKAVPPFGGKPAMKKPFGGKPAKSGRAC